MNQLRIDHIAILVDSLHETLNSLESQGVQCQTVDVFPEVGMKIAFATYKGKQLEFLEVISPDSPAANHKKGLHHLAFIVDHIHDFHAQLKGNTLFKTGNIRPGRHSEIFFFELLEFNGIQYECMQNPDLAPKTLEEIAK